MNGCSFQQVLRQNFGWFLSKHCKTLFLRGFILKPTERGQVLSKNGTRDFQNKTPFDRSACFHVTISENFKCFQYFNFENIFWKTKNFFKNWSSVFQLKALKVLNTSLPYKTVRSEARVKTNRMVSTEVTYHKGPEFCQ